MNLHGDILKGLSTEKNPQSKGRDFNQRFKVCYWLFLATLSAEVQLFLAVDFFVF